MADEVIEGLVGQSGVWVGAVREPRLPGKGVTWLGPDCLVAQGGWS